MKLVLLGAAIATMAWSAAYAQNATPPEPHTAPTANQTAPTTANQTAPTTPDMKGTGQTAPTPQTTNAPKAPTFIPDQTWVGRYVYSSDNKDLGTIASVKRTGASSDIFFDMGGFLGLGATRKHVAAEQVREVQSDRIMLDLNKAQAENLPEGQ